MNKIQNKSDSYKSIFKATSLFGGVQVISIVRAKFIAVLLVYKGMSIARLLRSTIQIISKLTNRGIGASVVKNIIANVPSITRPQLV